MSDTATISCIIPVYNAERYLGETLDSVFSQTYRPIEVIVVDDGSTDGTAALLAERDDQITVISQSNAGPANARNRGLEAARGDFIAFVDGDDIWPPEKLSAQMACFVARPELDICLSHMESFWTPDLADLERQYNDPRAEAVTVGSVTQVMLARRSLFDRIGGFDPSFRTGEDQDWYLRAAEAGAKIEILPEIHVRRRLHPANMTRRESDAINDNLVRLVKRSLDRRRERHGGQVKPLNIPESSRKR